MVDTGRYKELPYPKHRELLGDLARITPKHTMQALVEFDITRAREIIRRHEEETGRNLSLTSWLIRCIAQATNEYKQVQGYRKGKKLIVFDDVDVGFAMERASKDGGLVSGAIVRKANEKNVLQIHEEIRAAQTAEAVHGTIVGEKEEARLAGFFQSMPGSLRRLAIWWYRRDPFLRKRTQGTIGITSIGNILGTTSAVSSFPIVSGPYPLFFGIAGITKKPGLGEDGIGVREYLPMSVMFDHDVVDGADAARFLETLGELLNDAYGLESI